MEDERKLGQIRSHTEHPECVVAVPDMWQASLILEVLQIDREAPNECVENVKQVPALEGVELSVLVQLENFQEVHQYHNALKQNLDSVGASSRSIQIVVADVPVSSNSNYAGHYEDIVVQLAQDVYCEGLVVHS